MKQRKIRGIKRGKRRMCKKIFLISKEENRGIRGEKVERKKLLFIIRKLGGRG